ncbi:MAG: protease inhibitor I42 family protein [Bacteroidales bacterium]
MKNFKLSFAILSITSVILIPFFALSQDNVKKSTLECKLGKEYKIELPSTPSTGYNWTVGSPFDTTLILFKGREFIPGKDTTLPGKPGTDVFTFKAVGKGKATVRMVLRKEYARKVSRAEDFEFIITK